MNLVFKALADPTRRRVLELLRKGPMTAGELSGHFPVSKPTMSAHFAVLREADLVDQVRAGKTISYILKVSVLEDVLLGFAGAFARVGATRPAKHQRRQAMLRKGKTQ
jgi:DNA-binding transcriptional ArsR family regulator